MNDGMDCEDERPFSQKQPQSIRSESPDDFEFDNEETREEGDTPDKEENDASFNKILQNIRAQIDRLEKQKDEVLGGFPIWQNPSAGQYDWQGGYYGGMPGSRPGTTGNYGGSPGSRPGTTGNMPFGTHHSPQSPPQVGNSRPGTGFIGPMGSPMMPTGIASGYAPNPFTMPYGASPAPFNFDPYTGKPVTPDQVPGIMMPGMIMNPYIVPGAVYPGVHPSQMPYVSSPYGINANNSATKDERARAIASNLSPVVGSTRDRPDKGNNTDDEKKLKSTLCSV